MRRSCSILSGLVLVFSMAAGADLVKVKGYGKAPADSPPAQARLLAVRAAKLDGFRKLAAAAGFRTDTKEGTQEAVEVQAYLKNFKVTGTRNLSDYEAEVDIEMPLVEIIDNVAEYRKNKFDRRILQGLQEQISGIEQEMSRLQGEIKRLKDALSQLGGNPR